MALGRVVNRKIRLTLVIVAVAIVIAAAFGVFYINGAFLPRWIEWKEVPSDVNIDGVLKKGVKFQELLLEDIDRDGEDELLILCWKIGRYGDRKPFWVKRDELSWSQHIYIYEVTDIYEPDISEPDISEPDISEPDISEPATSEPATSNNASSKVNAQRRAVDKTNMNTVRGMIGGRDVNITPLWMASDIHTDVACFGKNDEHLVVTISPDKEESLWMWDSWGLVKISDIVADLDRDDGNNANDANDDNNANSNSDINHDINLDGAPDNRNISIVMVGDVLLHDGVVASCKTDEGYDFTSLFSETKDVIESADIAIVNQEVILGGEELRITGYPAFNAPYEVGDALVDAGFDVVCHATNHALDRGKKGITNCLSYWRVNHPEIATLGIHDGLENSGEYIETEAEMPPKTEGEDLEDNSIYIKEVNGFKIAILNYTYGTNGIPLPKDMPYAVDLINKEKIADDLQKAEAVADFTIVCPHWGIEYQLKENGEQDKLAEFMTENGADLIIGTHPHVIEPVKWVESENGNRSLCYYSLGNFINWTSGRGANVANRMVGGMAYVEIAIPDWENEESKVFEHKDSDAIDYYAVLPLISHVEHKKGEVKTYFLKDYTEDCAQNNAIIEQDNAFNVEYCYALCGEVWEDIPQDIVE